MNTQNHLIPVKNLSNTQSGWLRFGLLSRVSENQEQYVLKGDLTRLDSLSKTAAKLNYRNPYPTSLFPTEDEISLGKGTILVHCASTDGLEDIDDIFYQMLPLWIEEADEKQTYDSATSWGHVLLKNIQVFSNNTYLLKRIQNALSSTSQLLDSRAVQFARSASYMGSKANLAPYFVEILKDFFSSEIIVLDLMCGSGAAAGVFSNFWRTIASDAQIFSRMLAVVQGGGMNSEKAKNISDKVLSRAREIYGELPDFLHQSIDIENDFLSSELSTTVLKDFYDWILNYPRINNPHCKDQIFADLISDAKNGTAKCPILFSAYYANLFFGVRQSAEIDCLRAAIGELDDEQEKHWALGALICSVSSRAFAYGGHFAQPKLDFNNEEKVAKLVPEILVNWGQSVSHEFFIRLNNLGTESENVLFPIRQLEGPWQNALSKVSELVTTENLCVYLDPPYTRDEYSRYYHVLETLTRYDYPNVQDKPSIPKRGEAGRFASKFSTRNADQVERLILEIIEQCLEKNWSCMWSYSSSATASIIKIIHQISYQNVDIRVFSMDYTYKAQGKSGKKNVKEHVVLIRKEKIK